MAGGAVGDVVGDVVETTFRRSLRTTFSGHPSKPNLAPISPLSAETTLYTFSLQAISLTL